MTQILDVATGKSCLLLFFFPFKYLFWRLMELKGEKPKTSREDLLWIDVPEKPSKENSGLKYYLVPIGCLVTAGILGRGVYHMLKKDSRKQQLFMRYRVLAQGVTVVIALFTTLQLR